MGLNIHHLSRSFLKLKKKISPILSLQELRNPWLISPDFLSDPSSKDIERTDRIKLDNESHRNDEIQPRTSVYHQCGVNTNQLKH